MNLLVLQSLKKLDIRRAIGIRNAAFLSITLCWGLARGWNLELQRSSTNLLTFVRVIHYIFLTISSIQNIIKMGLYSCSLTKNYIFSL